MKGYKGFDDDWTCKGFQYKVGETYEMDGEISLYEKGFHFCTKMEDALWYYPNGVYVEVEALGDIIEEEEYSNHSQYVTNKIKIVRQLSDEEIGNGTSYGEDNTGVLNFGDNNSGSENYGHNNKGKKNYGGCNSGAANYGNYNQGFFNYGKVNSGNKNYGDYNIGICNYGSVNSGNQNYGTHNIGSFNYGSYNEGSHNYGDFNLCNKVMGCFNTVNLNNGVQFFDKPCHFYLFDNWFMSRERNILMNMSFNKSYRQSWWDDKSEDDKSYLVSNLPNFDAEIFYKITGISIGVISSLVDKGEHK